MALGIFETLDWLKKQDKRLCCRIDQVYDELSAELATKITNQQGTPSFRSDTLANLPAPGQTGRMFISTDTFAFYRDNGAGWDLIGGPGIGTVTGSGIATQVAFWNGTSVISGSSNLYWDSANNRLGVGISTPAYTVDISGTLKTTNATYLSTSGIGNTIIGSTVDNGKKLQTYGTAHIEGSPAPFTYSESVLTIKNMNTAGQNTYGLITLDNNVTSLSYADIRLGANPTGLRLYAASIPAAIATGAAIQMFRITDPNFPGQVYFDSGAHNSSALIFRTAPGSTALSERMRVFSNGNVGINVNGVDSGYLLRVNGGISCGTGTVIAGWGLHVTGGQRTDGTLLAAGGIQTNTIGTAGSSLTIQVNNQVARNLIFNDGGSNVGDGNLFTFNSANVSAITASGTVNYVRTNCTVNGITTGGVLNFNIINPTINQTTGTGTIYGYRFSPTNTAVLSTVWAFYADSGRTYLNDVLTIGTTTPSASALLQVDSTTRGFLPPRMTQAQRTAIASPAVGLIVYQTDATEGLYVNTSTGWRSITMV